MVLPVEEYGATRTEGRVTEWLATSPVMSSPRMMDEFASIRQDMVECGFERMAEVQEEILWLCEAGTLSRARQKC